MTTNILDEIMAVYPKHLIGAAWLYHEKHKKLPPVSLLVRTFGAEFKVGASETAKHDASYMALWGMVKTSYVAEDALENDTLTLDAMRRILGSTLAESLASGHTIAEAARREGVSRVTIYTRIREAKENFSLHFGQ